MSWEAFSFLYLMLLVIIFHTLFCTSTKVLTLTFKSNSTLFFTKYKCNSTLMASSYSSGIKEIKLLKSDFLIVRQMYLHFSVLFKRKCVFLTLTVDANLKRGVSEWDTSEQKNDSSLYHMISLTECSNNTTVNPTFTYLFIILIKVLDLKVVDPKRCFDLKYASSKFIYKAGVEPI